MEQKPIKITYWNIRGITGYVFSLCEYTGTPYEFLTEDINDKSIWHGSVEEHVKNGLQYPNLPWMEDGDVKLSESFAIMNYIAEKAGHKNMIPATQNMTKYLQYHGLLWDLGFKFGVLAYFQPNMEEFKNAYEKSDEAFFKLRQLDAHLGKSPWLLGDKISILDFFFADLIERLKDIEKDTGSEIVGKMENLQAYVTKYWEID